MADCDGNGSPSNTFFNYVIVIGRNQLRNQTTLKFCKPIIMHEFSDYFFIIPDENI